MKKITGVAEFADNYDAFILDVWGVIHDGQALYPGVLDCLKKLNDKNKKIVFLSNAPRRASKVKKVLAKFGIVEGVYLDAVSSGEVAYEMIANDQRLTTNNYFYIGPEKDKDLLAGLNLKEANPNEAEFALVTGFDKDDSTLEEKLPEINQALEAGLKLYCVNPDKIVVRQDGTQMLCAGVIGEYYWKNGGEVEFIGKPYPQVYEKCFALLEGISKSRIVAIGDSLENDIVGANNVKIDSVLALSGILKIAGKPYQELITEEPMRPKMVIEKFNW